MSESPQLSMVVPTYNEVERLEDFVRAVCRVLDEHHLDAEIIVVDDNSPDGTGALADRLADAFAEYLHAQARKDWGIVDQLSNDDLIDEKFQGIRPAFGYPACPDHSEKRTLFDLLDAERNASITLTESYAMLPGAAVSGFYFSHRESRYFGIGKVGRDQVADYAVRKGLTVGQTERLLAPNLAYDR